VKTAAFYVLGLSVLAGIFSAAWWMDRDRRLAASEPVEMQAIRKYLAEEMTDPDYTITKHWQSKTNIQRYPPGSRDTYVWVKLNRGPRGGPVILDYVFVMENHKVNAMFGGGDQHRQAMLEEERYRDRTGKGLSREPGESKADFRKRMGIDDVSGIGID
jgi:hypothetical protein